jgi:DNA-binding transcriptional MerR regulator
MDKGKNYRIGDLARMFGVRDVRTIRYYEELGLLQSESRDGRNTAAIRQGTRFCSSACTSSRNTGSCLAEIAELFALARRDRSGELVRKSLAESYRAKLDDALKRREALDRHIDELSWHIDQLDKVSDFNQCPGTACAGCLWSDRCDVRLFADDGFDGAGKAS